MEKHWRGKAPGATLEAFWESVLSRPRREDMPPVVKHGRTVLVSILRGGLFFLAVTTGEMPSLLVVELLHRIVDVFEHYFGSCSAASLTKAFSVAYQLLDEMIDHGYPLITEPNALESLIDKPSLKRRLSSFVTGSSGVKDSIDNGALSVIPWRKTTVSYVKNEFWMDIVEEVDAVLAANGSVVHADVRGTFAANSKMSGMPDLTLYVTDTNVVTDSSLHPCVRLARFARDKVISFVPPDGHFTLFRYRAPNARLTVPLYLTPSIKWRDGVAKAKFIVGTKPMSQAIGGRAVSSTMSSGGISSDSFSFGAAAGGAGGVHSTGGISGGSTAAQVAVEDVVVRLVFPKAVESVNLTTASGHTAFDGKSNVRSAQNQAATNAFRSLWPFFFCRRLFGAWGTWPHTTTPPC